MAQVKFDMSLGISSMHVLTLCALEIRFVALIIIILTPHILTLVFRV